MNSGSFHILGISGSLRKGSYCTAVLRTLQEALKEKADFRLFPLNEIPLYNEDLDTDEKPAAVKALKEAIAQADGLVLVSPEYNYGISGVLKNAIDWASRPGYQSVLKDKPVLVMSASPAFTGGARAQDHVRKTLFSTLSRVVPRPEVTIAGVQHKVQDGRLTDETSLRVALEAVDGLFQDIRLLRRR